MTLFTAAIKNGWRMSKSLVFLAVVFGCSALFFLQWQIIGSMPNSFDVGVASSEDERSIRDCQYHNNNTHTSNSLPVKNPIPRDLSIVFLGDSITRYQYTSLVYFLRHGEWFDPRLKRSIVSPPTFATFHNGTKENYYFRYFQDTNKMLHPYEVCDCHRNFPGSMNLNETVINRYYYDPILNNAVTFLVTFGHNSKPKGRIIPKAILKGWKNTSKMTPLNSPDLSFTWAYQKWSALLRFYVSKLNPFPKHVIMNAGWWGNLFLRFPKLSNDMKDAIAEENLTAYWRTTTYGSALHFRKDIRDTDELMCEKVGRCWNVSWTKDIHHDWYWDKLHFLEPVYRAINEVLLEEIGALPDGYRRMDKSIVFSARSVSPF